jgi:hypothetical protein
MTKGISGPAVRPRSLPLPTRLTPALANLKFVRRWSRENGAPSDSIRSLLFSNGKLWVGSGAGLSVFGGKTVFQGRPAIGMTAVGTRIWVSNNAGLAEVDALTESVVSNVSKADGLLDDEAWAYGPVATDPEGRIYLGTPSGLSVFDPSKRETNTLAPVVRLRRIARGSENDIDFEYAALTFADESRVRYRTRLGGFDRDWSPETADAKIRYTNLPAVSSRGITIRGQSATATASGPSRSCSASALLRRSGCAGGWRSRTSSSSSRPCGRSIAGARASSSARTAR